MWVAGWGRGQVATLSTNWNEKGHFGTIYQLYPCGLVLNNLGEDNEGAIMPLFSINTSQQAKLKALFLSELTPILGSIIFRIPN